MTTTQPAAQLRDERGSSIVGLALAGVAFVLLFGLLVAGGRVAHSHNTVTNAASAAARAASLTRTAPEAREAANAAARAAFTGEGLACTGMSVSTRGGFDVPVGQAANVTVTVECTTSMADLGVPGLRSRQFSAEATSPLDKYRGRG